MQCPRTTSRGSAAPAPWDAPPEPGPAPRLGNRALKVPYAKSCKFHGSSQGDLRPNGATETLQPACRQASGAESPHLCTKNLCTGLQEMEGARRHCPRYLAAPREMGRIKLGGVAGAGGLFDFEQYPKVKCYVSRPPEVEHTHVPACLKDHLPPEHARRARRAKLGLV